MQGSNKIKVFVSLVLVVVFATLVVVGYGGNYFVVKEIDIQKMEGSKGSYLFAKIKKDLQPYVASLIGKPVWSVGLNDLMEHLSKDSRVAEVSIRRGFPNRIQLKIEPHRPVAMLLDRKNILYPIAFDGSLLPKTKASESLDLPIFRGKSFEKNEKLREQGITLLSDFPKEKNFSTKLISEIGFDKRKGFILFLAKTGSVIYLGHNDFADKLSKLERVLNYLNKEGMQGRVIDARFSKKVVVKLRNAP